MTQSLGVNLHGDHPIHSFPLCRTDAPLISAGASSREMPVPEKAFSTDSACDVLDFAVTALQAGCKVALCTLVEIRGGSSRPLGSHMAVTNDGRYCGYVSGGCTEAAIAAEALQAIANGHDRFVMLGEGSPFFDIVLPCGGGITVAIHIIRDVKPLSSVTALMKKRQTAGLSYAPGREQISLRADSIKTGWDGDAFVTSYCPGVRVVFSGRSLEVEMAANVAKAAGYEVILYDHSAVGGFDMSLIDANTAVALLQHDLDLEMPVFEAVLAANPFYIGALGSARTHEKRVERLRESGHSGESIGRIKAPIGLFGKARDAQSLAVSVIADIAACRQSLLMQS